MRAPTARSVAIARPSSPSLRVPILPAQRPCRWVRVGHPSLAVPRGMVAIWSQFRAVVARPCVWQRPGQRPMECLRRSLQHQIWDLVLQRPITRHGSAGGHRRPAPSPGCRPGVHHLHRVLTLADVPTGRGTHGRMERSGEPAVSSITRSTTLRVSYGPAPAVLLTDPVVPFRGHTKHDTTHEL
jgi:hypothetical protein